MLSTRISRDVGPDRFQVMKGKLESRLEEKSTLLLRAIEKRYRQAPSASLQAAIRSQTDLARLDAWFDLVFKLDSLEEYERQVSAP